GSTGAGVSASDMTAPPSAATFPSMKAAAALLVLLLASCATQTCWRGGIPLRDTERSAQWGAEVDILRSARDVEIYRGLAHPQADTARYERQVDRGGWVEFQGFKFHKKPA